MATKIGNDYLVWVAAPATTPTYWLFGGQQSGVVSTSREEADASHKTSGGYALSAPGLRRRTITLEFVADLPDTGYTVVETAEKSSSREVLVQIRRGGVTGADPADVIFAGLMGVTALNVNAPLNGVVGGSVTFSTAAAPTFDLTLA
jgi:predicted secreted protein